MKPAEKVNIKTCQCYPVIKTLAPVIGVIQRRRHWPVMVRATSYWS